MFKRYSPIHSDENTVSPNSHSLPKVPGNSPKYSLALELKHRRKLKIPRLYSVQIKLSERKTVNKMLGVAFTLAQRQRFYNDFKVYESWGNYWQYRVKFISEVIGE